MRTALLVLAVFNSCVDAQSVGYSFADYTRLRTYLLDGDRGLDSMTPPEPEVDGVGTQVQMQLPGSRPC